MAALRAVEAEWAMILQEPKKESKRWLMQGEDEEPKRQKPIRSQTDDLEQIDGRWRFKERHGKPARWVIVADDLPRVFMEARADAELKGDGYKRFVRYFLQQYDGATERDLRRLEKARKAPTEVANTCLTEGTSFSVDGPQTRAAQNFELPGLEPGENVEPPASRAPLIWPSGLYFQAAYEDFGGPVHAGGPEVDALLDVIERGKRLVIVCGAGISSAAGIPDFRSSDGLLRGAKMKDLFDSNLDATSEGQELQHKELGKLAEMCLKAKPTAWHLMQAHMAEKPSQSRKLGRIYTQNIDGLETRFEHMKWCSPLPTPHASGKSSPITICLHGTLAMTECTFCHHKRPLNPADQQELQNLHCEECHRIRQHKRLPRHAQSTASSDGRRRPMIVRYNDPGNDKYAEQKQAFIDCDVSDEKIDVFMVVGTSLAVPAMAQIVKRFAQAVKSRGGRVLWINSQRPGKGLSGLITDQWIGDCQDVAAGYLHRYVRA